MDLSSTRENFIKGILLLVIRFVTGRSLKGLKIIVTLFELLAPKEGKNFYKRMRDNLKVENVIRHHL